MLAINSIIYTSQYTAALSELFPALGEGQQLPENYHSGCPREEVVPHMVTRNQLPICNFYFAAQPSLLPSWLITFMILKFY